MKSYKKPYTKLTIQVLDVTPESPFLASSVVVTKEITREVVTDDYAVLDNWADTFK